jgi:hypothetical protein
LNLEHHVKMMLLRKSAHVERKKRKQREYNEDFFPSLTFAF